MNLEYLLTAIRSFISPPESGVDVEAAKAIAATALKFVPVGMYGTDLYDQINRLWTNTAVETPCIEWDEVQGQWMIWLRLRGPKEAYPNQYEVGGSPLNPGETYEEAARRTVLKKFGVGVAGFTELSPAAFFNQEERGWYRHLVCPVQFECPPTLRPPNIIRVRVDDLPENMCEPHRRQIIPPALAFVKNRPMFEAGESLIRLALAGEHDRERLKVKAAAICLSWY